jgi:hypothetical protein
MTQATLAGAEFGDWDAMRESQRFIQEALGGVEYRAPLIAAPTLREFVVMTPVPEREFYPTASVRQVRQLAPWPAA